MVICSAPIFNLRYGITKGGAQYGFRPSRDIRGCLFQTAPENTGRSAEMGSYPAGFKTLLRQLKK